MNRCVGVSLVGLWLSVASCAASDHSDSLPPAARPAARPAATASTEPTHAASTPPSAETSATPVLEPRSVVLDTSMTGAPPAGVPATAYASLFEAKRSWKISGTAKHERDGSSKTVPFTTICTIDAVDGFAWGLRSTVSCNALPRAGASNLLAGTWFATVEGLFHYEDTAAGLRIPIAQTTRVLPALPRAETFAGEGPEQGFSSRRRVYRELGAWCFQHTISAGDDGWRSICVDAKRGFVSGNYGWSGAATDDVVFSVP